MSKYPTPERKPTGDYIVLGGTSYPYSFETMIGDYDFVIEDINRSYDDIDIDVSLTYFEYLTDFIANFGSEGGNYANIINGTIMQGGVDALIQYNGFLIPNHVYTNANPTLQTTIDALEIGGTDPADVTLYLQYDGSTTEWKWVQSAGIQPPEEVDSVITTENAIPKWSDDTGTGLLNTGVLITENNEMHGQGVLLEEVSGDLTLTPAHRGKILKYALADTLGGDIKVPDFNATDNMIGFQCVIINSGEGTVSIVPDTTNTLEYKLTAGDPAESEWPNLDGRHSAASLIRLSDNVWGVYGDLEVI